MAARLFRGAAAATLFAAAALVGGCGGDSGTSPALLAGDWSGSLSISYAGGGASGALTVTLEQEESFVSGIAEWAPVSGTQSITGPVDGSDVTLYLHFRCGGKTVAAGLTGTFDGTSLTITSGNGLACTGDGAASAVSGASGSLSRTGADNAPL